MFLETKIKTLSNCHKVFESYLLGTNCDRIIITKENIQPFGTEVLSHKTLTLEIFEFANEESHIFV